MSDVIGTCAVSVLTCKVMITNNELPSWLKVCTQVLLHPIKCLENSFWFNRPEKEVYAFQL